MAFINNTPMIVGGGAPTPTTKKYKLKSIDLPTTKKNLNGNLSVILKPNAYMTNFWQWIYENSCPGLWELIITHSETTDENRYGLTPSYPNAGYFRPERTIKINFATNEFYNASDGSYERVMLNNAEIDANTNVLKFALSDLALRKDTTNSNGLLQTARTPLVSNMANLTITVRIIVLEESEE